MAASALAISTVVLGSAAPATTSPTTRARTRAAAADKGSVTISGQDFPEVQLVASMYEQLLEDEGYDASVQLVDSRDVYMGAGQFPESIQLVPEYVGGIVDFLNTTENGPDAEPLDHPRRGRVGRRRGADLLEAKGITLLDLSAAIDTNAFFVTQEFSESEGVTKLSDLEGKSVVVAAAEDCDDRTDCGRRPDRGLRHRRHRVPAAGLRLRRRYKSVLDGESQLGLTSTTDGTLESQGLVLLEDDKQIQPAQNLVPAVSPDWLADNPDVEDILNPLMAALTTEKLTELNGQISVDRAEAGGRRRGVPRGRGPALTLTARAPVTPGYSTVLPMLWQVGHKL